MMKSIAGAAVTLAAGLFLLGACAPQAEERAPAAATPEEAPVHRYEAPAEETSPLIHDLGAPGSPTAGQAGESYDAAAEQCHNYARAVVLQDRRITHDRDTRRSGQLGSSRTFNLQRSMQDFGEQGSYERHFASCMESRGAMTSE